jgi:hypothetical protein
MQPNRYRVSLDAVAAVLAPSDAMASITGHFDAFPPLHWATVDESDFSSSRRSSIFFRIIPMFLRHGLHFAAGRQVACGEGQEDTDFGLRKSHFPRPANEVQTLEIGGGEKPMPTGGPLRMGQEANALEIADRLDPDAGKQCELTNRESVLQIRRPPGGLKKRTPPSALYTTKYLS